MAKIKLTGDTKDAQDKLKRLRDELKHLDADLKKPRKVNVQTSGIRGGSGRGGSTSHGGGNWNRGTGTGHIQPSHQAGGAHRSSGIGTAAGAYKGFAMGGAVGGAVGAILGSLLESLTGAIMGTVGGLTRMITGIGDLGGAIEKFNRVAEIAAEPSKEAASRASELDRLHDQARRHNATTAEEIVYSKAAQGIGGEQFQEVFERFEEVLHRATSGKVSEMTEAWGILRGTGITFDSIQNQSTWANFERLLAAYHNAGLDGDNELEEAVQQIFEKRGMGVIRAFGDGTELRHDANIGLQEYAVRVAPHEQEMLSAQRFAEVMQMRAAIADLGAHADTPNYVEQEARSVYETAAAGHGVLASHQGDQLMATAGLLLHGGASVLHDLSRNSIIGGQHFNKDLEGKDREKARESEMQGHGRTTDVQGNDISSFNPAYDPNRFNVEFGRNTRDMIEALRYNAEKTSEMNHTLKGININAGSSSTTFQ